MIAKSEYNRVFANNLRRIMHERDKNGADMARYLGVGKSRVSSWMNAQHIPRPDMVDKICAYLNCTRSDLMEENGIKHGSTVSKEQAELVRLAMHGRADNVHLILEVFRRMEGLK